MWSICRYYGIGVNVCYSTLRSTLHRKKLDFIRLSGICDNPSKDRLKKRVRLLCTKNSDKSSPSFVAKIHGHSPKPNHIKPVIGKVYHTNRYHDLVITGFEHDKYNKRITFKVQGENQNRNELDFTLVEGWELSPFEEQNILFDIQEYDAQTLPDWIKDDFCLPQGYTELIQSGHYKLYYIDPAVGMGGYIIAGRLISRKA